MANVITCCRILFSIAMTFFPAFSPGFHTCYLLAGLTDMIDGAVARRLGTQSDLGARLDTAADMVFLAASACKLLPAIDIPRGIWVWICVIALIKLVNIISGLVLYRKLVSPHTIANKAAGSMLFVWPMTLSAVDPRAGAIVVCAVSTFAAIQEGHFIRTGRLGG